MSFCGMLPSTCITTSVVARERNLKILLVVVNWAVVVLCCCVASTSVPATVATTIDCTTLIALVDDDILHMHFLGKCMHGMVIGTRRRLRKWGSTTCRAPLDALVTCLGIPRLKRTDRTISFTNTTRLIYCRQTNFWLCETFDDVAYICTTIVGNSGHFDDGRTFVILWNDDL